MAGKKYLTRKCSWCHEDVTCEYKMDYVTGPIVTLPVGAVLVRGEVFYGKILGSYLDNNVLCCPECTPKAVCTTARCKMCEGPAYWCRALASFKYDAKCKDVKCLKASEALEGLF